MGLILIVRHNALVVELAYTCGLGPHPVKVAGSNPAKGTNTAKNIPAGDILLYHYS